MNKVVTGMFRKARPNGSMPSEFGVRPVAAAAAAVERCLAQAHEIGDMEAVRLLHAVSALLDPSPKP